MKKVKICGLSREIDISYVNQYMPDYIGFVFAPSKRQVSREQAVELKKKLDNRIQAVGVFVNEEVENIITIAKSGCIDLIQLHGDEDKEVILHLQQMTGLPIIKAVRVHCITDTIQADELPCEYLLFDTYKKGTYGGTGETFSWNMIPDGLKHPYFLAGGLTIDNIEEAYSYPAFGYDISGGVESSDVKDEKKIKEFLDTCRNLEKRRRKL